MPKDERLLVSSQGDLWRWLASHHETHKGVWLVTYKKADPKGRYISYDQIVEALIAYGWVDSQPRALDEAKSMRRIAPRSPGSAWSAANRRRAETLEQEGRMSEAGRRAVEAAKKSGAWTRNAKAEALVVPEDLARALTKLGARKTFDSFPPSSRRIILEWIEAAKRDDTRQRRIAETAEKAARGERANHYR